jgi:hypothetical protein
VVALAVLVIVVLLIGGGVWRRRRQSKNLDSTFMSTLAIRASAAGTTLMIGALSVYVVVARAIRGGSIENSLPPGMSEDTLLSVVILGAIIAIVAAWYRYLEHLDS